MLKFTDPPSKNSLSQMQMAQNNNNNKNNQSSLSQKQQLGDSNKGNQLKPNLRNKISNPNFSHQSAISSVFLTAKTSEAGQNNSKLVASKRYSTPQLLNYAAESFTHFTENPESYQSIMHCSPSTPEFNQTSRSRSQSQASRNPGTKITLEISKNMPTSFSEDSFDTLKKENIYQNFDDLDIPSHIYATLCDNNPGNSETKRISLQGSKSFSRTEDEHNYRRQSQFSILMEEKVCF